MKPLQCFHNSHKFSFMWFMPAPRARVCVCVCVCARARACVRRPIGWRRRDRPRRPIGWRRRDRPRRPIGVGKAPVRDARCAQKSAKRQCARECNARDFRIFSASFGDFRSFSWSENDQKWHAPNRIFCKILKIL